MTGQKRKIRMVEVGPRDGLQNEPDRVPLEVKRGLVDRLLKAGLSTIEVGAFVSPKWVPQMADSDRLLAALPTLPGVSFPVLVPNQKGLERALGAGAREIAIFGAASESFSQKNINCSISEARERFRPVCQVALAEGLRVRGYLSCVIGCPYEGPIDPRRVAEEAQALEAMGCYEISLGDTIGVGRADEVRFLLECLTKVMPAQSLAVHFHDTYGQALANVAAALEFDIAAIDSSVAGLGGCPYAPGASGNLASEDLLYFLDGMGIETGVDLKELLEAGWYISNFLGRAPISKVSQALGSRKAI